MTIRNLVLLFNIKPDVFSVRVDLMVRHYSTDCPNRSILLEIVFTPISLNGIFSVPKILDSLIVVIRFIVLWVGLPGTISVVSIIECIFSSNSTLSGFAGNMEL